MLSVETTDKDRIFKNRLSIFNGDICWDARRFWHKINVDKDLPPVGEEVERVEWTPGEGSGPTKPIVWQRTAPPEPIEEEKPAVTEEAAPAPEATEAKEASAEATQAPAPEATP